MKDECIFEGENKNKERKKNDCAFKRYSTTFPPFLLKADAILSIKLPWK